jgi:polyphosphate glucokinase
MGGREDGKLMRIVYGIDVGGSGIKGGPVDIEAGRLAQPRTRIETPQPATPAAVYDTIEAILSSDRHLVEWDGPIGVAVPAVVVHGVTRTAANIDPSWIGEDARNSLTERLNRPVVVLNDADAAGFAEMRYGTGRGVDGVVILLTFGTGIGSAVFVDGSLVPNTELGHLEFRGGIAEAVAAARLVERDEINLEEWARTVDEFLHRIIRVFSPQLIVVGGGISKRFDDYAQWLDVDCEVVPAQLRNDAGIVGAAVAAARA